MKYLNLTPGFNPTQAKEKDCLQYESTVFPGGEPHFRITEECTPDTDICISIRINSFNDLGLLCVAHNALYNSGWLNEAFLIVPYFPGARQDRICNPGEALTVEVYADIINEMDFQEVEIFDPHSDVAPALIDKCSVIDNHEFVRKCLIDIWTNYSVTPLFHIISPDAGANKKVKDLLQNIIVSDKYVLDLVKCDKTRNLTDGKLSGFEVYSEDLKKQPCIIVDDICDGGGTFLGLAKELKEKNAGDLYLVVSHGIFSKGLLDLTAQFKCIYTTDSIGNIKHLTNSYQRMIGMFNKYDGLISKEDLKVIPLEL